MMRALALDSTPRLFVAGVGDLAARAEDHREGRADADGDVDGEHVT
jgi:hypothetical protein